VGSIFSPEQLWRLGRTWWDDRLELDWRRKTVPERQELLRSAGLTGEFWQLG